MTKKVIQVPIDEGLLKELDDLSKKLRRARAELIRHACLHYLRELKYEELDRLYQQGYVRIPEEPGTGEIQVAISGEFVTKESW
ncbi:MAG: hypothetical protein HY684_05640 [Chloroflexi bacterium]|nr:hypothetical protein [Chloroflexota bacterium]